MPHTNQRKTDITNVPDGVANSLLCSSNETVCTAAGFITPLPDGMLLTLAGARRPRHVATAKSAIYYLRKATKGGGACALRYRVADLRAAGLEAKWGKTSRGTPAIFARWPGATLNHQRTTWWMVDANMFENMKKDGVLPAFNGHTLLGDLFSIGV